MPDFSHQKLLALRVGLGYPVAHDILNAGICNGFSQMWVQAILANDEATFMARLNLIAHYDSLPLLLADIQKSQSATVQDPSTTDEQKRQALLRSIPAFFDGVELYGKTPFYRDVFGQTVSQANIQTLYAFNRPHALEQHELQLPLQIEQILDEATCLEFFKALQAILKSSDQPMPISIHSHNHAICLRYDKQMDGWILLDVNQLALQNPCVSTQDLVSSIWKAVLYKPSETAALHITLHTTACPTDTQEALQQLQKKYAYQDKQPVLSDSHQISLLSLAVQTQNHALVRALLNRSAGGNIGLNTVGPEGRTAIQIACQNGDHESLTALLNAGAKLDQPAQLLRSACLVGGPRVLTLLLEKGLDPNSSVPMFHLDPSTGQLTKNHCSLLLAAASSSGGTAEAIQILLSEGKVNPNQYDAEGYSPLARAAAAGNVEAVSVLLEHGSLLTRKNSSSTSTESPLKAACFAGHQAVVSRLITAGAKLQQWHSPSDPSPLCLAILGGHTALVKWMLEEQGVYPEEKRGREAKMLLYLACVSGDMTLLQHAFVAQSLHMPVREQDASNAAFLKSVVGLTPLEIAEKAGHTEIARKIRIHWLRDLTDVTAADEWVAEAQWEARSYKRPGRFDHPPYEYDDIALPLPIENYKKAVEALGKQVELFKTRYGQTEHPYHPYAQALNTLYETLNLSLKTYEESNKTRFDRVLLANAFWRPYVTFDTLYRQASLQRSALGGWFPAWEDWKAWWHVLTFSLEQWKLLGIYQDLSSLVKVGDQGLPVKSQQKEDTPISHPSAQKPVEPPSTTPTPPVMTPRSPSGRELHTQRSADSSSKAPPPHENKP